jgi:hypothetical protein
MKTARFEQISWYCPFSEYNGLIFDCGLYCSSTEYQRVTNRPHGWQRLDTCCGSSGGVILVVRAVPLLHINK